MKHIKKFETFDFSKTQTLESNALNCFYSCEECDSLWESSDIDIKSCRFCDSDEVEELESSEYFELKKNNREDVN